MAQWSNWDKKRHPDNPVVFFDIDIAVRRPWARSAPARPPPVDV